MTEAIKNDFENLESFTLFLNDLDVADIGYATSRIPPKEYENEATAIWVFYKDNHNCSDNTLKEHITQIFKIAFEPLPIDVPADDILKFLKTLRIN